MSNGDPCICGDTETWHPECYHKQRQEANEAHDAKIHADGYREGMVAAAGMKAKLALLFSEMVDRWRDGEPAAKVKYRMNDDHLFGLTELIHGDIGAVPPAHTYSDGMRAAMIIAREWADSVRCQEERDVLVLLAQSLERKVKALAAASETANQCDGCNASMPLENGIHQSAEGNHMCCSKGRYGASEPAKVPEVFGCYCELPEGDTPDGCVIDAGNIDDCCHAQDGVERDNCKYWRPISVRE